jgi:hypothetical protein
MLRFLRSGQTASQSRRKLRDVLILLLRCAIIVLIAMLFAQPILHIKPKIERTSDVYYLGLDNSMSMAYSDGTDRYLDKLIKLATEYIQAAGPHGVFNLCPLASGHWQQGLTKEQALAAVKDLKVTPGCANLGDFLSVVGCAGRVAPSDNVISALLLSDFTPNTLRQLLHVQEPAMVHNVDYKQIVSPGPIDNAAIIAAQTDGIADDKIVINVTVANYGQVWQKRVLTVRTPENESGSLEVNLAPNQHRVYQTQIDAGLTQLEQLCLAIELSLSPGDGLREDDTFYLGVFMPQRRDVRALLAYDSPDEIFLIKTALDTLSQMSEHNRLRVGSVSARDLARSHLDSADVLICSGITDPFGRLAPVLEQFVRTGGRIVFFMTDAPSANAMTQLWQHDLLPALPQKCLPEQVYVEPKPCDEQISGIDNVAAKALTNYRIDKIAFKRCWQCTAHRNGKCLWKFQNGLGFVYLVHPDDGISILVNTSVDDSLGSLTKSSASVAFCRFLLGEHNQLTENCFAYGERVALAVPDTEASLAGRKEVWVETCDAQKHRVALSGSAVLVLEPGGIGWVRTLGKPTMYAGVNLPEGETDMNKPPAKEVADVMSRVFHRDTERNMASVELLREEKQRPLWRIFAWTVLVLLIAEPAIANRLKR